MVELLVHENILFCFPDMRRDVQEIFRNTPHGKQVMMFSATLSKEIRPVCKKFMQDVIINNDLINPTLLVKYKNPLSLLPLISQPLSGRRIQLKTSFKRLLWGRHFRYRHSYKPLKYQKYKPFAKFSRRTSKRIIPFLIKSRG